MIGNDPLSVRLPSGGVAPVLLPPFAAAYSLQEVTVDKKKGTPSVALALDVVMKTPSDDTFADAVRRAYAEDKALSASTGDARYAKRVWIPLPSVRNGHIDGGSPFPYWNVSIVNEPSGAVSLRTADGNKISEAYRTMSDRGPTYMGGFSDLAAMMSALADQEDGEDRGGYLSPPTPR